MEKACDGLLRGGEGPEGGTTQPRTPNCLPSDLALGQPHPPLPPWRPAHPDSAPHRGGASAHPTHPHSSPEPPLPCLECARRRNQVFSQANPCHLGWALPPTKGLLFPGPRGPWGQDWVEAIWAPAAWPGHPPSLRLPSPPSPSLPLPPSRHLPTPSLAQLHPLQVSKANG